MATPYKIYIDKSLKLIDELDNYKLYEWCGRLYLVRYGYKLAEIIEGKSIFNTKYKGSLKNFIAKVKQKDLKKVKKMIKLAQEVKTNCKLILDLHSKKGIVCE